MLERPDPLIGAAVRPITDPELRLAASGMWSSIGKTNGGKHDSEAAMIVRWETADVSKSCWKRVLYVLAALSIAVSAMIHFGDAVAHYHLWTSSIFEWGEWKEPARKAMDDPHWTENERLLLFGDPSRRRGEEKRTLWERKPDDPALFAEYASDYLAEHKKVPDELREVSSKIDPDNAYPDYLEASYLLENVAERKRVKSGKSKPAEFQWVVKDQKKLLEGLEIAERAIGKTRYDSYEDELTIRRSNLLREGNRLDGVYRSILISNNGRSIRQFHVMKAFSARASQLAAEQDREGFVRLLANAEALVDLLVHSDQGTLIGEFVTRSVVMMLAEDFGRAADQLGFASDSERLIQLHKKFKEADSSARSRRKIGTRLEDRGDLLFASYLPTLSSYSRGPSMIDEKDLLPGSKADHALASRGLALAAGLLAGLIAASIASVKFLFPKLIRTAGDRLAALLGWSDYLWIIGLGVILPGVYVLGISYVTPFGCRHWSLSRAWAFLPTAHFIAWVFLMLVISVLVGRWRLNRRAGILGVGANSWVARTGWYSIAGLLAFVPLIGAYIDFDWPIEPEVWWLGVLLAPAVIWLSGVMLRPLFGRLETRLTAAASSVILVPVLSCFVIVMMLSAFVFEMEDDHWFRSYNIVKMRQSGSPVARYEAEIQKSMRRELLEIFDQGNVVK